MSSYSISDEEDNDNDSWKVDLETILLDDCDFAKLRSICRGRCVPDHLRKDVWRICLNSHRQATSVDDFDNVFNLPEQTEIHTDCEQFANTYGDDNSLRLMSDLESIITHFSRVYNTPYTSDNGWLNIIRGLVNLNLDRFDLYAYFSSLHHRYIATGFGIDNRVFPIFRLLLQYHEPELCSFLDTKRVFVELFAKSWFTSLFSVDVSVKCLPKLWDIYFLITDPFLMFYLALVVLVNVKDQLLQSQGSSTEDIVATIMNILPAMDPDDVEDFCSIAQHYSVSTPESFRVMYTPILFGNAELNQESLNLINSLCLPLTFQEILQSQSDFDKPVKFLLVDCRPPEQYNAGHLSNAFYLDSHLMLRDPKEFQNTAKALLMTQRHALAAGSQAAGEHICFMSSGREEEDGVVHMVIAHFLQNKTAFISMAYGGYCTLHEILGLMCNKHLVDHDSTLCLICISECGSKGEGFSAANSSTSGILFEGDGGNLGASYSKVMGGVSDLLNNKEAVGGLINRFSSAVKVKSAQVKEKVVNYVKNEPGTVSGMSSDDKDTSTRHISKAIRNSKPYRNMGAVFSIDDHEDEDKEGAQAWRESSDEDKSIKELINLDLWLAKPDVLHSFSCRLVGRNNVIRSGYLLLTDNHLFVLSLANDADAKVASSSTSGKMAYILHRRSLATVAKITSKKKLPEMITFHYSSLNSKDEDNVPKIIAADKTIIPNAGEAARLIKIQIQKVLDSLSE